MRCINIPHLTIKSAIFCFSSQSCVLQFLFPYLSGGVDGRPGRFFWHQYGSNWTLYYAAADKIIAAYFASKSVLLTQRQCRKDFGTNSVPDRRTIQCLVVKFRNTGSVADAHKDQHRSSFGIIPENIQNLRERHVESPRKLIRPLLQETGISRTWVLRILHDDLKLLPYKIQILQRQTYQNKAEREIFCEDTSQRIENDPELLDLNDLNDVDHCDLCGASATFSVSRNLATKRWIVVLSGTLFLAKSLLRCCCVRRIDFAAKYASMIFMGFCVENGPVGSILVSKESPRPAVYTTWKIWKKL